MRHGHYTRPHPRFGYSFGTYRAGEHEWGIQSWRDRWLDARKEQTT